MKKSAEVLQNNPLFLEKVAVELRTQLRTSVLCVIRYESTEQSERSRQCCQ